MRVVIVGAGKLGYTTADLLTREKIEVVVIDKEDEQLEAIKNGDDVGRRTPMLKSSVKRRLRLCASSSSARASSVTPPPTCSRARRLKSL